MIKVRCRLSKTLKLNCSSFFFALIQSKKMWHGISREKKRPIIIFNSSLWKYGAYLFADVNDVEGRKMCSNIISNLNCRVICSRVLWAKHAQKNRIDIKVLIETSVEKHESVAWKQFYSMVYSLSIPLSLAPHIERNKNQLNDVVKSRNSSTKMNQMCICVC